MRLYCLVCCLLLVFLLSSCNQIPSTLSDRRWLPSDVRLLDPADQPDPSLDLVAAYTRLNNQEIQVRLDWLDHALLPDYDLFLALDTSPGGAAALPNGIPTTLAWDLLISIPNSGELQVLDDHLKPVAAARLRVERDSWLDSVTIRLSSLILPGSGKKGFYLQALLLPAGQKLVVDSLGPWHSEDPSPPRLPLLLAFWNSYPAPTPALALRRWDGAHSGPFGGRHGLGNLLRTAASSGTPLFLLDYRNPTTLAAIDFIDRTWQVQMLVQQNLLTLPETIPNPAVGPVPPPIEAYPALLRRNQLAGQKAQLPPSSFVFSPAGLIEPPGSAKTIIIPVEHAPLSPAAILRWRQWRVLPVPGGNVSAVPQASPAGPSPEFRKALISAALQASQDPTLLLVLGGSLPDSAWGDPQSARATFRYLQSRPWLRFLDGSALQSMPVRSANFSGHLPLDSTSLRPLFQALQAAPKNKIQEAAWLAFQALYSPTWPQWEQLSQMRQATLPAIWSLIAASHWASASYEQQTCQTDPDQDGQFECLLASHHSYAQFELPEGVLSLLVVRLSDGSIHQLIGPSTQLSSGLSDPTSWTPVNGIRSEPGSLRGAFDEPDCLYQPALEENTLTLRSPDGTCSKTFTLSPNLLTVTIRSEALEVLKLPLLLDPWLMGEPNWAQQYRTLKADTLMVWQAHHLQVQLAASVPIRWSTFLDSRSFLAAMENPNWDYPPGHFLPFPMALAEFPNPGNLEITLSWQNMSGPADLPLP